MNGEIEKTKKYLASYHFMKSNIEFKKEKIDSIYKSITTPNGLNFDTDKVQSSNGLSISEKYARLFDLQSQYYKEIVDAENKCKEILEVINKLDNTIEKEILARYYCGELRVRLYDIADRMGYSEDHIRRYFGKALKNVNKILNVATK